MSHYTVRTLEITNEAALVAALKELGFTPEVHAEARQLVGYQGDARAQRAHVIVRRDQLTSASNDLGFLRGANGKYEVVVSEYDERAGYGVAWQRKLQCLVGQHVLMLEAPLRGFQAERRKDARGRPQVVLVRA